MRVLFRPKWNALRLSLVLFVCRAVLLVSILIMFVQKVMFLSAVVKAIGGLDSVKKITGVEVNEVKAVGVLTKTVGVGKRITVDKPVIPARSFKDD